MPTPSATSNPNAASITNTPDTSKSNPVPTTAPTPVATATPVPKPQSTPTPTPTASGAALTVQITDLPSQVQNNSNQTVNVVTNTGNTTVVLNVNYSVSNDSYTSASQTTDSTGKATISWRVHSSKVPNNNVVATLIAVATDPNGQKAQSPSYQVAVVK